ncbi:YbaB/EbfC family nucleoid-associated protein [Nocardia amamiensis]|uniref:YbaB/EbfC family nucleoid-associated protein n=1 Tax=Nocardia amamiensis TaxID=404578 RepID=UPI000B0FCE81|nr:YbaB/EbfC family nucleoid-associated protein [Nocardia amamiensis]
MDRWEREGLRSANNGMRNQLEHLLDSFERQQGRLADAFRELENARTQASSPDQSVEVTVDAAGVLTDLRLTAAAMRQTPEQLSRAIVDATQAAARRAQQQTEAVAAPVDADLDDLPDLPDISPDAPSLNEIRAFFRGDKEDSPR